jgi:hypothetical protein
MRDDVSPFPPTTPRTWDWRLAVSALLGLIPIVFSLVRIVPEFDQVFRQIKVPMPTQTEAVLGLSRIVCEYLWLVGIGVVFFVLDVGHWTGRKAAIARVMFPLMTVIIIGWMVLALFLPLMCSFEGIGPRRH